MPHIETVTFEEAEGELKQIYENLVESRGKLAEVHKIHSLNPSVLVAHMELYMAVMFGKSPLKRYQREMIGVVVSAANNCDYCVNHHEQALLAYW
ncbi:carboxymuconolactone decarboxylase family protein [Rhodohalobacter sp. 8-1]|uniref:carboxymuconolactone decarboxylase family protein n=1 Tax=Rhodohalobacter sp. 8-1 TaxID=3131972 RepID=UPI0030EC86A6